VQKKHGVQVAVDSYLQWDVTTTVSMNTLTDAKFPAVTICNMNPIKRSYVSDNTQNCALAVQLANWTASMIDTSVQMTGMCVLDLCTYTCEHVYRSTYPRCTWRTGRTRWTRRTRGTTTFADNNGERICDSHFLVTYFGKFSDL
jgi:hypothetical protein